MQRGNHGIAGMDGIEIPVSSSIYKATESPNPTLSANFARSRSLGAGARVVSKASRDALCASRFGSNPTLSANS
jgi:hypothetical protein